MSVGICCSAYTQQDENRFSYQHYASNWCLQIIYIPVVLYGRTVQIFLVRNDQIGLYEPRSQLKHFLGPVENK